MTVFYSSLWRKLWCLSPYCGHLGVIFARGCVLHPCHRLLRQYSHSKAGLVTAAELVSYWQDVFEANEIPEARASSEYIVSYVLGAKTFQSLNAGNISPYFSVQQQEQVEQLCAKRLQRMPVQYVLGEWDFQDLTLKMKPPVFIPRRETEELVTLVVDEECRKRLPSSDCKEPRLPPETHGPVILEVGCGSGAIALSLLKKLPHSKVIAIDKLEAAVNLTKENAESYEDLGALDGGSDGMNIIREILHLACYLLKDYGSVFLEVEPRHPEMVKNWLRGHPDLSLVVCGTHKDFCGKLRFLHIQKHGR
ncbi:MTRF1L release factor glutamine methyltransferase isoform X3 [Anolis carolinensis]|uniref:MTRF1L release factor glutamine methyltransferase isoform X3 n=1 Tax=Anolis carolinensis TaxID=28377 RepID=UPI0007DB6D42|nr:PREDICTED: hemK methyltransferase family member 1 isoform X3 [Anolis carolinensis]|eukprot:XP_016847067.1 PREDICTED: hemK methyltransferase family member 1 isoform X3 [Anolis carolinensis]